jgi:hypothetical protein
VADRFDDPAAFVAKAGLAYLFGGARAADLPNLHHHVTGRDRIEEWGGGTELVWECRAELPLRGAAWFGEWLRGRGTFVAVALLPAALGWCGRSEEVEDDVAQAWDISPDAGMVYEAILSEGPIASMTLRRAVGLDQSEASAAFQAALKALQRGLFITTFGHEQEHGAWASSVYEPTMRAFPHLRVPGRDEGLAALVGRFRRVGDAPTPAQTARLFRASVDQVRAVWS